MSDYRNDDSRGTRGRRGDSSYGSRVESRTARTAARKREATAKMWRALIPLALVLALVVILLIVFGGGGGGTPVETTVSTVVAQPKVGSGLLVIEQQDGVPEALLFSPTAGSGVVVAVPGITLLKTAVGFRTVAQLYDSGGSAAAKAALEGLFGVQIGAGASVEWSALREAMTSSGLANVPPETLSLQGDEAESLAQAALALFVEATSEPGAPAWDALSLDGDGAGLREAVAADAGSLAAGWTAGALTGKVVEGIGFEYLDPDTSEVAALIGGIVVQPDLTDLAVDVLNGGDIDGAATAAASMLEGEGYALSSVGNYDDPSLVLETRITVAPGETAGGDQIRAILGVGVVAEDETQVPGTALVILGMDFTPPVSGDTEPTE